VNTRPGIARGPCRWAQVFVRIAQDGRLGGDYHGSQRRLVATTVGTRATGGLSRMRHATPGAPQARRSTGRVEPTAGGHSKVLRRGIPAATRRHSAPPDPVLGPTKARIPKLNQRFDTPPPPRATPAPPALPNFTVSLQNNWSIVANDTSALGRPGGGRPLVMTRLEHRGQGTCLAR